MRLCLFAGTPFVSSRVFHYWVAPQSDCDIGYSRRPVTLRKETVMPFVFNLDGKVFNTEDLTVTELARLEDETGKTWLSINPFKSVKEFRAIAETFLLRSMDADAAKGLVSELPLHAVMSSIEGPTAQISLPRSSSFEDIMGEVNRAIDELRQRGDKPDEDETA
jgi:hypothetical protein